MFSKLTLSLLAFMTLAAVSCTPKIGEAPPPPAVHTFESLKCLTNLKPVLASFSKGEASDDQVVSMWACSQEAIRNFKRYVYGRTEDRFSPDELAKFLQDNFLDPEGPKITPELQAEFMQIKRLIVGGSSDYLTREELDVLVSVLGKFQGMSLEINPYIKVLIQHWDPRALTIRTADQIQHFEKASEAAQAVARELAAIIYNNHQDYDLNRVAPLVKEFSRFTQQDGDLAKAIDAYVPVLRKIKKAVAGGDENQVQANEWRNFTLIGAKGYLQYLRYHYFVALGPDGDRSVRTDYLMRSLEDFINGFKELIGGKPADAVCGPHTLSGARVALRGVSCITKKELMETLQAFANADPSFKVSAKLVDQVMNLKAVYFGGSTDSLATPDLERGGKKMEPLRELLQKLLPYYSVYFLDWNPSTLDPSESHQWLSLAQTQLTAAVAQFGTLLEGPYDLQNLIDMLSEIEHLYGDKNASLDPHSPSHQVAKFLPLVTDVKSLLFGDADTVVRKAQWSPFLALTTRGYGAGLQYYYFASPFAYGTDAFLDGLKATIDTGAGLINGILEDNKNHAFSAGQMNQLVRHLSEADMLPQGLSAPSLRQMVDMVLARVAWPAELRLKGSTTTGFSAPSLNNLRQEFQIWYETEKVMTSWGSRGLKHDQLQNEVAKKLKDRSLSAFLRVGLAELSLGLSGAVPKVLDSKQRLIIDRNSTASYKTGSLVQLNLHRAVARLVTRSAIESRNRLDHNLGLTLQEAQNVFGQLRPALVELGLVDSDNLTFIEGRFRESNVFTAHSNGDTLANFQEIMDEVGMLFSGASINTAFQKNIAKSCGVKAHAGRTVYVSEDCIYDVFYVHTPEHMASLPHYLNAFKKASPEEFKTFFLQILKAAGHIPNEQHTVRLSKVALTPHVIQYMEMMYAKYDADQNDLIDTDEALNAYPSFSGVLIELTKDQTVIKPEELPALFTYILYYGEPPGGMKDYVLRWLPWKNNRSSWKVAATRQQAAKIFAFIAEKTRDPK